MENQNISMVCNGQEPLCVIPINGTYILGIYKGKVRVLLSELKESDAAVLGASALGWEVKPV